LTRGHLKKFKKIQKQFKKIQKNKIKNSKKPRSDTWHDPGLTRVHLRKILKKIKKI